MRCRALELPTRGDLPTTCNMWQLAAPTQNSPTPLKSRRTSRHTGGSTLVGSRVLHHALHLRHDRQRRRVRVRRVAQLERDARDDALRTGVAGACCVAGADVAREVAGLPPAPAAPAPAPPNALPLPGVTGLANHARGRCARRSRRSLPIRRSVATAVASTATASSASTGHRNGHGPPALTPRHSGGWRAGNRCRGAGAAVPAGAHAATRLAAARSGHRFGSRRGGGAIAVLLPLPQALALETCQRCSGSCSRTERTKRSEGAAARRTLITFLQQRAKVPCVPEAPKPDTTSQVSRKKPAALLER
jgi:hypothetical protein